MEGEYLIDCNRASLKGIFYKGLAEKESQHISFAQLIKFCSNTRLFPELVSSTEIKRLLNSILKKTIFDDKSLEIYYLHFEIFFKSLAEFCFPSGNSINLLISHIKHSCLSHYNVILTSTSALHESTSKSSLIPKPLKSSRIKSNSVRRRKVLSSSTLHKDSSSKVELMLSPREQTMMSPKVFESRTPRLKIIKMKTKLQDEQKLKNIEGVLLRFQRSHNQLLKSKRIKLNITSFIEKFIESRRRIVRFIQSWLYSIVFQIWKIKTKAT